MDQGEIKPEDTLLSVFTRHKAIKDNRIDRFEEKLIIDLDESLDVSPEGSLYLKFPSYAKPLLAKLREVGFRVEPPGDIHEKYTISMPQEEKEELPHQGYRSNDEIYQDPRDIHPLTGYRKAGHID